MKDGFHLQIRSDEAEQQRPASRAPATPTFKRVVVGQQQQQQQQQQPWRRQQQQGARRKVMDELEAERQAARDREIERLKEEVARFVRTREHEQREAVAREERVLEEEEAERERRLRAAIPELRPDEAMTAKNVLARALKDREALFSEHKNAEIKGEDLTRLGPGQWLNDELINFYMGLIVDRQAEAGAGKRKLPRCHCVNTFWYPLISGEKTRGVYAYDRVKKWTRDVDLFALDKFIVPVHMGNHWCLAVANMRDKRIEYYDSLGGSNKTCVETMRRFIKDEARTKNKPVPDVGSWDVFVPRPGKEIPAQHNGYDCGLFACKYADCIARDAEFVFDQSQMPRARLNMVLEITTKKLLT
eukprot:m51a1_g7194 putative sentrin sumo-specific protease (359) ;mRNA; r:153687-161386